jgi:hypothetical protein
VRKKWKGEKGNEREGDNVNGTERERDEEHSLQRYFEIKKKTHVKNRYVCYSAIKQYHTFFMAENRS